MRGFCIAFVMLALLVVHAGRAAAQPGNTAPGAWQPPPPPPPTVSGPIAGEKSASVALTLSLGGTVGSYVLAVAGGELQNEGLSTVGALGIFVAPTFGHWYAGKAWSDGLTMRLAGTGAMVVGAIILLGDCGFEGDCDDGDVVGGAILIYGGAAAFVAGGIYDIATAPGQARKYNARLRERAARGWALAPSVSRDRAGLVFSGRF
jgi:hypothetical protein